MAEGTPCTDTCKSCGMPLAYDAYISTGRVDAALPEDGICTFCAQPELRPVSPSTSGDAEWILDLIIRVYRGQTTGYRALARAAIALAPLVPYKALQLAKVINSIPYRRPDSKYDAVVLYSGGKDSSYMLLKLANRGLRLCAWMLQQGYQSPDALANARNLCESLGVPLHIEAPGKRNMDRLFRLGFDITADDSPEVVRPAMTFGSACWPCFAAIAANATRFCQEHDAAFCFIGTQEGQNRMDLHGNPVLAGEGLPNVNMLVTRFISAFHKRVEERCPESLEAIRQGTCRTVLAPFYEFVEKPPVKDEIAELEKAGWKMPNHTGACSTNCMVNELGRRIMRNRFGFDLYQIIAANERRLKVRAGAPVAPMQYGDAVNDVDVARAAAMMKLSAEDADRYGLELHEPCKTP